VQLQTTPLQAESLLALLHISVLIIRPRPSHGRVHLVKCLLKDLHSATVSTHTLLAAAAAAAAAAAHMNIQQ
jgi:hypothetical protein